AELFEFPTVSDLIENVEKVENVENVEKPVKADKHGKSDNVITVEIPPESDEDEGESPDSDSEKKPTPPPPGIVAVIFSVVTSIALFCVLTAGQAWFIVRDGINNKTVLTMTKAVIDTVNIADFPIFNYISANDFEMHDGVSLKGDELLARAIYNTVDDYFIQKFGIDEDSIGELLERRELRNFLYEVIEGGIGYIMGGDDTYIVKSEKIIKLIKDNESRIKEITDYKLVQSDYNDISEVLTESGIDDLTWDGAFGLALKEPRNFLSFIQRSMTVIMVIIAVSAAVLTAILILLNRRRLSGVLMYFGIPCIVSGAGILLTALVIDMIFNQLKREFGFGAETVSAIQQSFSQVTQNVVLYSGLTVLGTGVVAVAVKVVLSKFKSINE
ncbi:MAG: hypothetical protein FWF82_04725, partial [Oscillospiraceae bacterium]|nr:hypothetical protein [Oscillospiraceae bacterium]